MAETLTNAEGQPTATESGAIEPGWTAAINALEMEAKVQRSIELKALGKADVTKAVARGKMARQAANHLREMGQRLGFYGNIAGRPR